jgi:TonB family protein
MLELTPRPSNGAAQAHGAPIRQAQVKKAHDSKQPRRLVLALVLLLVTFAALIVKDRQFWFGTDGSDDADLAQPAQQVAQQTAKSNPVAAPNTSSIRTSSSSTPHSSAAAKKQVAKDSADPKPADTPAVTATRTVLPPLDIEVVAGDTHHKLHPGSNVTKLEITTGSGAGQSAPATNAAERETIADATPSYPLLAQHMNVQGSVVLQALIGADGAVQNLRVLNGPPILVSAAQQAVREWRFKPIVQNGQAVESKATITVNFSIKVADNSSKTTLAESRAAESLTIIR